MASSLININEATAQELQQLEGIGPKRSTYIVDFRNQVALIRNTFDLATATGLSIRAAERLSSKIDWTTGSKAPFGFWPAIFVTLASLWLIMTGFDQLMQAPFTGPQGYYNLSLALILLAGLSATGEIVISTRRKKPGGTNWVSILATCLFSAGFFILVVLILSTSITSYSPAFQQSLDSTGRFIAYCIQMFWLIYGPAFCLRWFIEDKQLDRLDASTFIYDASLLLAPILPMYHLFLDNHLANNQPVNLQATWTTEIFSLWCAAMMLLGSLELIREKSAFVGILSEADQSRFRFAFVTRGRKELTNGTAQVLGWTCLAEAVALAGFVISDLV